MVIALSRRGAITALASLAAISPASSSAAASRIQHLWAAWKVAHARFEGPITDDDADQLTKAQTAIEREIAASPAMSLADVTVKLQLIAWAHQVFNDQENGVDDLLIFSAAADLERWAPLP